MDKQQRISRRALLKTAGILSMSLLAPGMKGWAARASDSRNTSKLIVIFLRGGVDGLNVVVPYSDSRYHSARPGIAIGRPGTEGGAIELDSDFGLHPSLAPLLPLWKEKTLAFVANSGSPDPTRSHFDAQDYMETGMPGNKLVSTGWMNRLLEQLPGARSPVSAINFGATVPRILQGKAQVASYEPGLRNRAMPLDRPVVLSAFEAMYAGRQDTLGQAFRDGIAARREINSQLDDEMLAADRGAVPARNFGGFGKQLGRLFCRQPATRLAFVGLGGFDTHINEGGAKGQLANHLRTLGTGIADLVAGLGPAYKDTVIVVISEFGRTVRENGNAGTDHGHGNFMWLLGGPVCGGKVYGHWDGLNPRGLFEGRDLPVTADFRTVIGPVIREHLKLANAAMDFVFPGFNHGATEFAGIIGA